MNRRKKAILLIGFSLLMKSGVIYAADNFYGTGFYGMASAIQSNAESLPQIEVVKTKKTGFLEKKPKKRGLSFGELAVKVKKEADPIAENINGQPIESKSAYQ